MACGARTRRRSSCADRAFTPCGRNTSHQPRARLSREPPRVREPEPIHQRTRAQPLRTSRTRFARSGRVFRANQRAQTSLLRLGGSPRHTHILRILSWDVALKALGGPGGAFGRSPEPACGGPAAPVLDCHYVAWVRRRKSGVGGVLALSPGDSSGRSPGFVSTDARAGECSAKFAVHSG